MATKNWLILIGALGLGLRIALALTIKPVLLYDSLEYHSYAKNLVKEHRYYTDILSTPQATETGVFYSVRAPGYVFFVAAIYELFGINDKAVSLVQAVLDLAAGIFLYLIARRWLKPQYSLLVFAAYQLQAVYVPMLMSEAFFIFLFMFSLWIFCGKRASSWGWMVMNGLAWGLILLTKPEMVIFVPVFLGYLVWKDHSQPALAKPLAWLAIPALMIAPWLAREEHVHHRFVWMTTRGGMTFFDGNYLPIEKRRVMAAARNQGLDEAGMDRLFFRVTLEYLKKHPGHYFRSSFKRLRVLLDLKTYDGMGAFVLTPLLEPGGNFRSALAFLTYYMFLASRLVMILGLIGAILSWKRFPEFFLIYAVPLMIILFHFALFLGKPRYLVPAYPSLCIFSALAMERLTKAGPRE